MEEIFPILCGSAIKGTGIPELMDAVVKYLPGPSGSRDLPLSAVVYKVRYDESLGRIVHIRLYNGSLKPRDMVANVTSGKEEKVTQVKSINGPKYQDAEDAGAGEIAAVTGLNSAHTGDILGSLNGVPQIKSLSFPYLKMQVYPVGDDDYLGLVDALMKLSCRQGSHA